MSPRGGRQAIRARLAAAACLLCALAAPGAARAATIPLDQQHGLQKVSLSATDTQLGANKPFSLHYVDPSGTEHKGTDLPMSFVEWKVLRVKANVVLDDLAGAAKRGDAFSMPLLMKAGSHVAIKSVQAPAGVEDVLKIAYRAGSLTFSPTEEAKRYAGSYRFEMSVQIHLKLDGKNAFHNSSDLQIGSETWRIFNEVEERRLIPGSSYETKFGATAHVGKMGLFAEMYAPGAYNDWLAGKLDLGAAHVTADNVVWTRFSSSSGAVKGVEPQGQTRHKWFFAYSDNALSTVFGGYYAGSNTIAPVNLDADKISSLAKAQAALKPGQQATARAGDGSWYWAVNLGPFAGPRALPHSGDRSEVLDEVTRALIAKGADGKVAPPTRHVNAVVSVNHPEVPQTIRYEYATSGLRPRTGAIEQTTLTNSASGDGKLASFIAYDKNAADASGSTPDATGAVGDEVAVARNGFSRPGHDFSGWNTKPDGSGKTFREGTKTKLPAEGMTLFAQWKLTRHQVVFKGEDGSVLKTQEVEHGAGATAPKPPQVAGKAFRDWDKPFDKVVSDLVVTARYDPVISVRVPQVIACRILADGSVQVPGGYAIQNLSIVPVRLASAKADGVPAGAAATLSSADGPVLDMRADGTQQSGSLSMGAKAEMPLTLAIGKLDAGTHADLIERAVKGPTPFATLTYTFETAS